MDIEQCREKINSAKTIRELNEFADWMKVNRGSFTKEQSKDLAGLYFAKLTTLAAATYRPANTTIH